MNHRHLCIVHHLGLGDHIMLNGMVRYFTTKYSGVVYVITQKHNLASVKFMYRDIADKVTVLVTKSTKSGDVWETVKKYEHNCRILPLATYSVPDDIWNLITTGQFGIFTNWAYATYMQAEVNPSYMYSKFRVDRSDENEDRVVGDLVRDSYIFVHDDPQRNSVIKYKFRDDLQIIKPKHSDNIFDYIKLLENAKEVHCIVSSFAWLVEMVNIGSSSKNFLHVNVAYSEHKNNTTVFRDDIWTFIKD